MDPVLEEVYSTVLSGAPYVIGAYALIWVVLMVFVIMMLNRSRKTQKDIDALRESIERRKERTSRPDDVPTEERSED
ncbi:MAG: heme exporter protein CcmD [Coriobacteriales bacterium]|jgi:heme exporter protein CcmD